MYPRQAGEDVKDLPEGISVQLAPLLQAQDRLTNAASSIVSASNDDTAEALRSFAAWPCHTLCHVPAKLGVQHPT